MPRDSDLRNETEGGTVYLAVDEGVLVKTGANVLVSVRHAIGGTDLGQLHEAVKREFLTLDERERNVRTAVAKMEERLYRPIRGVSTWSDESRISPSKEETAFVRQVAAKAARKLRVQREGSQGVWFGLGMSGLIGWSVAVPTLLGAMLGLWLDRHHPGAHSWTLVLLVAGLVSAAPMPGIGSPSRTRPCRMNRRIKMSETLALILALLAGALLGTIFFGGLWWTIRRGMSSQQPAALFFFSLLLRTGIALAGFYFVARGDWRRVLACLLGFFLARILVTRLTRVPIAEEEGSDCR